MSTIFEFYEICCWTEIHSIVYNKTVNIVDINILLFEQINWWSILDVYSVRCLTYVFNHGYIQGVQQNMTVARRLEGRIWSLKLLAALIHKPNFRNSFLELTIKKYL